MTSGLAAGRAGGVVLPFETFKVKEVV